MSLPTVSSCPLPASSTTAWSPGASGFEAAVHGLDAHICFLIWAVFFPVCQELPSSGRPAAHSCLLSRRAALRTPPLPSPSVLAECRSPFCQYHTGFPGRPAAPSGPASSPAAPSGPRSSPTPTPPVFLIFPVTPSQTPPVLPAAPMLANDSPHHPRSHPRLAGGGGVEWAGLLPTGGPHLSPPSSHRCRPACGPSWRCPCWWWRCSAGGAASTDRAATRVGVGLAPPPRPPPWRWPCFGGVVF